MHKQKSSDRSLYGLILCCLCTAQSLKYLICIVTDKISIIDQGTKPATANGQRDDIGYAVVMKNA